ncbi:MAG TPA: hypothetical protein VFR68_13765 [Candidatus Dormibacteraeota bacterium]|nr:hypothetical protein [Candidatus Dormibacteraeota bacterium]
MNQEVMRGAAGGAALGGSIGGAAVWLIGVFMLGLSPIVFLVCGVYAGVVYGSVMGAVLGAREREREIEIATVTQHRPVLGLAMARLHSQSR